MSVWSWRREESSALHKLRREQGTLVVRQEEYSRPFVQRGPKPWCGFELITAFGKSCKGVRKFTSGFGIGNFQRVPAHRHHHVLSLVGLSGDGRKERGSYWLMDTEWDDAEVLDMGSGDGGTLGTYLTLLNYTLTMVTIDGFVWYVVFLHY